MEHQTRIPIRWADLDGLDHVNHVVFLTYLEEARTEWLTLALGDPARIWSFVIAHVEVDYRRELTRADELAVASCTLAHVGTSSIRTRERITTLAGEVAADAEAVLVARDAASGRSRPLTAAEREALGRTLS